MSDPWEHPPVAVLDLASATSQHYEHLIAGRVPAELAAQLTRDFHTEAMKRLFLDEPSQRPLPDLRILMSCGSSKERTSRAQLPHSLVLD